MKFLRPTQRKLSIFLLSLILVFAFLIRVYNLSNLPYGFFADEASIGYNAYTLATTGIDEHEKKHPVFFEAFGEFKNPIQIWSTTPFIILLGANNFSIRLVSVFYSIGSLIALYLLTKEIFYRLHYKNALGIFAVLLLSITPWHIQFSRVSLEGLIPYIFFTTLGTYFFLKAQKAAAYFYLSISSFAIGLYCYFPARLFVPALGLYISLLYYKFFLKHKRHALCGLGLLLLIMLPLLLHLFSVDGLARWRRVSIFYDHSEKSKILAHIVTNYTLHFSPDFLFIRGDSGMKGNAITRPSVEGFGELYFLQFPLILLGIFYLFRYNRKLCILLLGWLFLYPLGSAFTTDQNPQATRSIIGIIPLTILTVAGGWYIVHKIDPHLRHKAFTITTLIAFIFLAFFLVYFREYNINYPKYSSGFWGWQYGPQDIIPYFLQNKTKYDQLILMGNFNEPYIFIKFYDPKNTCSDKCIIGNLSSYNPTVKQLYAISADKMTELGNHAFLTKKTLYYPDHTPAFYIGEFKKTQGY